MYSSCLSVQEIFMNLGVNPNDSAIKDALKQTRKNEINTRTDIGLETFIQLWLRAIRESCLSSENRLLACDHLEQNQEALASMAKGMIFFVSENQVQGDLFDPQEDHMLQVACNLRLAGLLVTIHRLSTKSALGV